MENTIYLVYETLYADLQFENDATNIIGAYDDIEKAQAYFKMAIEQGIDWSYCVDKDYVEGDMSVTMYQNEQDNFDKYYSIIIKEIEVQ